MNIGQWIGSTILDSVREQVKPKPQWALFGYAVGQWVAEYTRVTIAHYDPIRFEMWTTAGDERTCPICGKLHGAVYRFDVGFEPPAHDHCRCQRVYHHTEFNVRYTTEWQQQLRWQSTTHWEWRRTD